MDGKVNQSLQFEMQNWKNSWTDFEFALLCFHFYIIIIYFIICVHVWFRHQMKLKIIVPCLIYAVLIYNLGVVLYRIEMCLDSKLHIFLFCIHDLQNIFFAFNLLRIFFNWAENLKLPKKFL